MYPRSTVDMALLLSDADVLDRETALICDVSVMAIRHWRYGTRRSSRLTAPSCPRCDGRPLDDESYAYLLGLYLGDGHIARGRRDVYALTVACSDAWPGLMTAARLAMSSVMPASVHCPEGWLQSDQKYVQTLAVLISSAWSWPQAPAQDRAGAVAASNRPGICCLVCQGPDAL
jgi:hypothetical protein